jgi:dextranase
MKIVDLFPTKGFFQPGEPVSLALEVAAGGAAKALVEVSFIHLADRVGQVDQAIRLTGGLQRIEITWSPPWDAPQGYGVEAKLLGAKGELLDRRSTALDVLHSWTDFPRYGFLTDFAPGPADPERKLEQLARFHINGLQFYDWQYRHHQLLSPSAEFVDPLGRILSLETVLSLLAEARAHGMAALAYLAVYAAGLDFRQEHLDWALYDHEGNALSFAGFLGLMDPTAGRAWSRHLHAECNRVLAALPFDGLHVDQYGEPKVAFDGHGRAVDLPGSFSNFIHEVKRSHPQASVLFNAVGNWPIEALAAAPVDAVYIEMWPPATRYADVQQAVCQARALSGGKPVIIALYIPSENHANILLADALILSAGGTRIEVGEGDRLLVDPYFPKHQAIPQPLRLALRRYADFAVRYGEMLGPAAGEATEIRVAAGPNIWTCCRRSPGWVSLNLINTTGLADPGWNQVHGLPETLTGLEIKIIAARDVRQIWLASPDRQDIGLHPADWRQDGDSIRMALSRLDVWSMIALELR